MKKKEKVTNPQGVGEGGGRKKGGEGNITRGSDLEGQILP